MTEGSGAARQPPRRDGQLAAFVGRERELAALGERLDAAARGEGGVVLIAGEPGIGKTRLLHEFSDRARQAGWLVLSGSAYDTEGMPPYLPFVAVIRQCVTSSSDEDLQPIVEDAPAVASLVPELGRRFPGLAPAPAPALSPETERFRLFEAVSEFFLHAARSSEALGLLVCLDDLHWADPSTLSLLLHLSRKLNGVRLLLAGTYRPEEVEPSRPLFGILADMSRERLDERVLLGRWSSVETRALVEAASGVTAAEAVVQAIQRETDGNPFFVHEVVRDLNSEKRDLTRPDAAEEWRLPGGVREVIGKRLSRLNTDAQRLLEAAAVVGEGFEFELAAAVCGNSPGYLTAALEQAVTAGMLVEEGGAYRFGHPLIRRTVHDSLSLPRRRALHLTAAQVIESKHPSGLDTYLSELASHYAIASSAPGKTLEYCRRAAAAAAGVFAWQEAVAHYEGAIAALEASGDTTEGLHCDLLLALGQATIPAGDPLRAAEVVAEQLFSIAEAAGDGRRAFRACELALQGIRSSAAAALIPGADYRRWLERADRYAEPGTTARVIVDRSLGDAVHLAGRPAEANTYWQRALSLANQLRDPESSFGTAAALLTFSAPVGEVENRARLAAEFVARPREGVPPRLLGTVLELSGRSFMNVGNRGRAEVCWDEVSQLAVRWQDPELELFALANEIVLLTLDGLLESAVLAADRLFTRAEQMGRTLFGRENGQVVCLALLYLGRAQEVLASIEPLTAAGANWYYRSMRAKALAHLRRREETEAELAEFCADTGAGPGAEAASASFLLHFLEAATLIGDRDKSSILARRLRCLGLITHGAPANTPTSVARHLGAAAALCGEPEVARAHYLQALEVCEDIRFRPEVALTHLQIGELLRAHFPHERAAALAHLDFAIGEFEAMGMQPSLERALRLRGRRRRPQESDAASYPDGLTSREVEVLRLIAAGKSNREIAEDLVLSTRTVERHVTNIYAKIDARGKADATAYALRRDLI